MKQSEVTEPNLFQAGKKKKLRVSRVLFLLLILFLAWQVTEYILLRTSQIQGKAHATRELEIQCSEDGILKEVHVQSSSTVRAGDVLFELSNDELGVELLDVIGRRGNLSESIKHFEDKAANAKKRMESAEILFQNGVISRFDYDEAKMRQDEAKNELKSKTGELENLSLRVNALQNKKDSLLIRAPFDGVFIGDLKPKLGAFLRRGDLLGILFDPKEFYLEVSLPEGSIQKIHENDQARVSFNAFPGIYEGKVEQISAQVNEETERVYKTVNVAKLMITLKNFPEGLRPGMKGFIRFSSSFSFSNRKVIQS